MSHVERMKVEVLELQTKVTALSKFVDYDNEVFCNLPEVEQEALESQLGFMEGYLEVLTGRLNRATGKAHRTI